MARKEACKASAIRPPIDALVHGCRRDGARGAALVIYSMLQWAKKD